MKIKILRRVSQISVILLIIAIPLLNKKGLSFISGSLYSLAIGPVWITDPLSGLQTILSSLTLDTVLLLSMLIPVVLALVLGRVFCSWMCPQNALSELFDHLSEKIRAKGGQRPRLIKGLPPVKVRYLILVTLLIAAPLLGFPIANLMSAPGIISVQVTKFIYEGTVGFELGLIGLIILTEVFVVRRVWCNYICPVGSFLGIFRNRRTLKVVYEEDAAHVCGRCMACKDECRLGLDPMGGEIYPFCHNCGDCIGACKEMKNDSNPLSFRF